MNFMVIRMIDIPLVKTTKHCPKCKLELIKEVGNTFWCDDYKAWVKIDDVLVVKWIQETEHDKLMAEEYNKGYMIDR